VLLLLLLLLLLGERVASLMALKRRRAHNADRKKTQPNNDKTHCKQFCVHSEERAQYTQTLASYGSNLRFADRDTGVSLPPFPSSFAATSLLFVPG